MYGVLVRRLWTVSYWTWTQTEAGAQVADNLATCSLPLAARSLLLAARCSLAPCCLLLAACSLLLARTYSDLLHSANGLILRTAERPRKTLMLRVALLHAHCFSLAACSLLLAACCFRRASLSRYRRSSNSLLSRVFLRACRARLAAKEEESGVPQALGNALACHLMTIGERGRGGKGEEKIAGLVSRHKVE